MTVVENQIKKWGNFIGVIIRSKVARKMNQKEGQSI